MSLKFNNLFIFILSFYAVLWGTGWNIKYINLNISELFFPIITLYIVCRILFLKKIEGIAFNSLLTLSLFMILVILYSVKGYIEIAPIENSQSDLYYLYSYSIKLVLFIFLAFVIKNMIQEELDLNSFIKYFMLVLIPLYIFLHYKYMYVYQTYHTGVSLDGTGLKMNKNSFGGMIALIYPYVFCTFLLKPKKLFNILSMSVIVVSTLYLYSRSMTMIILFETLIISFIYLGSSKKRIILLFMILLSFTALYSLNQDKIIKYFNKTLFVPISEIEQIESISHTTRSTDYLIFDTHRGWLLHEAVFGAAKTYYIGNGLSTFRVRDTNAGSKTETHNDLVLIFYETGLFGTLFFLIIISYIITISFKKYFLKKKIYYLASGTSLIGLILMMNFLNFLNTFMFSIILGLSIAILNFTNEKKND